MSLNTLTPELPQHGVPRRELPDPLFVTVFTDIYQPIFALYRNKSKTYKPVFQPYGNL